MLDVKHQHIVFTIPHKFRFLICKNFSIIKPLFNAPFNVIIGSLNSVFKTTKKPPKFLLISTLNIEKYNFLKEKKKSFYTLYKHIWWKWGESNPRPRLVSHKLLQAYPTIIFRTNLLHRQS